MLDVKQEERDQADAIDWRVFDMLPAGVSLKRTCSPPCLPLILLLPLT